MSSDESVAELHPQPEWEAHLRDGRFMLLYSPSTQQHVFYPRIAVPGSGARDLVWVEASGLGTVYATTVIHPRPPAVPYSVALIDLAEGPRMMSRVEGLDPADVRIGLRVRGSVSVEDGAPVVIYRPVDVA
jgi:uncharacterized OB-fold protein